LQEALKSGNGQSKNKARTKQEQSKNEAGTKPGRKD